MSIDEARSGGLSFPSTAHGARPFERAGLETPTRQRAVKRKDTGR